MFVQALYFGDVKMTCSLYFGNGICNLTILCSGQRVNSWHQNAASRNCNRHCLVAMGSPFGILCGRMKENWQSIPPNATWWLLYLVSTAQSSRPCIAVLYYYDQLFRPISAWHISINSSWLQYLCDEEYVLFICTSLTSPKQLELNGRTGFISNWLKHS